MKIYLINKKTNEVLREFDNAISFADNYVTYSQSGNLGKIYASDDEYFTDTIPPEPDEGAGESNEPTPEEMKEALNILGVEV